MTLQILMLEYSQFSCMLLVINAKNNRKNIHICIHMQIDVCVCVYARVCALVCRGGGLLYVYVYCDMHTICALDKNRYNLLLCKWYFAI